MKFRLLTLTIFVLVVAPVFGGVGIFWATGWGAYAHNASNLMDDSNLLLDFYSATWQLVYAGPDNVADPVNLANSLNGWVGGDDKVWAVRTISQGGGIAPEDGTGWDNHMSQTNGTALYEDLAWTTNGYVYQRVYEGDPNAEGWYYQTPLLLLQTNYSNGVPSQMFLVENDPDNGGFQPNLPAGGSPLGFAVDAPQLVWTTGDSLEWAPTTTATHDGVDAAEGYAYSYSESWIETSVTGPIAVSFWWRLNSYMGGDLSFAIDGVSQGWSYSYDWQYAAYAVPAGSHTLRWNLYGGWDSWMGGGGASGGLDQVTLSPIAPEIEVQGRNSIVITNGSTTTSTNNGTDFGATFLTGATSNRTFTICNWGTTNLEISAATTSGVHSNDFQIVNFPSVVCPGTASNLTIRFDPSELGGRTAVVAIANNDADEESYSFAVSGTGIADGSYVRVYGNTGQLITNGCPTVTNALGTDFGWQYLTGASTSRTFFVTNAGNHVLNISGIELNGANPGDFAVLSYPATLATGARSNLVVQFDPAGVGVRTAVVEISSDAEGAATYSFSVGGVGVPDVPEILVLGTDGQAVLDGDMTPALADGTYFGGVPAFTGSADRVFAVTNSGSVDLVISNVMFQGAGAAHFSAPSVPASVGPGARSNLVIRFSPAAAGVHTAVVVIANNDTDENPYEFAVRGDGTAMHYVWTNSPSPAPPYLSWETAAHTIQTAAAICVDGDVIWATNGTYNAGSASGNRVNLANAVRLCSVNGPEVTRIDGAGTLACVNLGRNAFLAGFTITNGIGYYGGGIYGGDGTAIVSNCVIAGNQASYSGGGVYGATVYDSEIEGNTAYEGGGGAFNATLYRCRLAQNAAGGIGVERWCGDEWYSYTYGTVQGGGGGACQSTLLSCLVIGNSANAGGGAARSDLRNCTLVSNQSAGINYSYFGYLGGGGIFGGSAVNCLFDGNVDLSAPAKAEWDGAINSCSYDDSAYISYSCLTNPPAGIGNVTGRATFVADTFQLAPGSLGIDAGNNASASETTDLAGNPRIANGTADMGAYEYVPQVILPDEDGDGIPDDWESTRGLNSSVSNSPTADSDGDGRPDIEEYWADTHPTNGASFFPMVVVTNPPLGAMVLVVDPTSTARVYGVRWITNLLATPQIWTLIPPEKTGTGSAVSFTVTNDGPGRIYRTGVRLP